MASVGDSLMACTRLDKTAAWCAIDDDKISFLKQIFM